MRLLVPVGPLFFGERRFLLHCDQWLPQDRTGFCGDPGIGHCFAALSMDGMESLHNQIRGRGDAFAEAERFIRNLRDTGVPLTTVTTITQKCVGQLEELYRWVRETASAPGNGSRCPLWEMPEGRLPWPSGRRM